MPIEQGITPVENSAFVSSIGDWIGTAIWDPGPHGGATGFLREEIPLPNTIYEDRLPYPNCKLLPDREFFLVIQGGRLGIQGGNTFKATLTDGITEYTLGWVPMLAVGVWSYLINDTAPATWNEGGSKIKLEFKSTDGTPDPAVIDLVRIDIVIPEIEKVDHLPLMGIH